MPLQHCLEYFKIVCQLFDVEMTVLGPTESRLSELSWVCKLAFLILNFLHQVLVFLSSIYSLYSPSHKANNGRFVHFQAIFPSWDASVHCNEKCALRYYDKNMTRDCHDGFISEFEHFMLVPKMVAACAGPLEGAGQPGSCLGHQPLIGDETSLE
jgi:hypothetical protein